MKSFKKELKKYCIYPSYHRIKVIEYLAKHKTHPTVDIIYQELLKKIPTLSKTTVYNTLKLFVEKGIVLVLAIDKNELRYDYNTIPHAHFKCEKCGGIYDIEIPEIESLIRLKDFKVIEFHLYIKGICKKCLTF